MSRRIESLKDNTRGQMGGDVARTAKIAITVILVVFLIGLVASFLFPTAIGEMVDDEQQTITQNTGETVNLTSTIDVTLDSTSTAGDNATYTLADATSSETNTIDNGTKATFNLDDGDVTVNVSDVNSGSATSTFTYATETGWSDGATNLWNLLGTAMVLALVLMIFGVGLKYTDRI